MNAADLLEANRLKRHEIHANIRAYRAQIEELETRIKAQQKLLEDLFDEDDRIVEQINRRAAV